MDSAKDDIRWKINKEISLGDLLAVFMAFCSVMYAYGTLDKRLTVAEEKVANQISRDSRQDDEAYRYQQRIDQSLASINAKLDRLIEEKR